MRLRDLHLSYLPSSAVSDKKRLTAWLESKVCSLCIINDPIQVTHTLSNTYYQRFSYLFIPDDTSFAVTPDGFRQTP